MKITVILIILIGFFMENINAEPILQPNSPSILFINGSAMKALNIACDEFLASGKDVRDFNITISEKNEKKETGADTIFMVTFMGKISPGKRGLGTANRVPGSVTYSISKEKWKIIKEQGIK